MVSRMETSGGAGHMGRPPTPPTAPPSFLHRPPVAPPSHPITHGSITGVMTPIGAFLGPGTLLERRALAFTPNLVLHSLTRSSARKRMGTKLFRLSAEQNQASVLSLFKTAKFNNSTSLNPVMFPGRFTLQCRSLAPSPSYLQNRSL